ncbi:MAG: type II toxin-antitoxin system mRNA interferase toxin, RelE/StbE family [Candidatus Vogelbacteria bacterium CG10_big_fil_rev_8_21_14_0_10_51_16]|uniref:Type II toxin-antitoxin system mRNA interferase toxin, RelE/StbE family n=1 Tax=Candidatus Vogelbacteria bacterium CG10_big_fil_rev_8_21_14_0_10_51_16 TaxID=1975045 RepID=A0A2H0RDW7_9BACT|nr:MAG: type II toxin-antitoxin system mRNA interferase toxin, RelE/StbE family [Candidatus Vogelbacteria bacterium CG10_big_fil_rev_8_21_14_0_10_51_16]
MILHYSNGYLRRAKKLSRAVFERLADHEQLFIADPFDPRLDTHKLHGKDKAFWLFSITKSIRVKFEFLGNNEVLYVDIGPHGRVYR